MHSLYARFVLWLIRPAVERIAAGARQGGVRLPDRAVIRSERLPSAERIDRASVLTFAHELAAFCDEKIRAFGATVPIPSGQGIPREPTEATEQQSSSRPWLPAIETLDCPGQPMTNTDRREPPSVDRAPGELQQSQ